jgi:diacylglycerol kinase family enzyme
MSRTIGALFEFSGFPCGLGVCRRGAVYPGSKDPSDELDPCASIGRVTTASGDPTAPLILINPRASKIADRAKRDAVASAVIGAVRNRFAREPRVEMETLESTRAALAEDTDAEIVVVVGGDGTVREAATALIGRATPLAVVPAGTGNVLAGAVGIRGIRAGIDAIRHGAPRVIDLGRARWTPATGGTDAPDTEPHERIFAVACGMGLDARIMEAAEHEWKRRMGFGAYVGAAVREVLRLESAHFHIEADGMSLDIEGYLALVVNAGDLVPGRIGPRRPVDPSDGELDLIVLGGTNPAKGLVSAVEVMLRAGDLTGGVIRRAVREVVIDAQPAQPIETDGDPHPPGRLEAKVIPAALTILVPRR